jgi:hypothetical protein
MLSRQSRVRETRRDLMRVRQTSTRRVAEVLLVNRLGLRMVLHLVILLATNVSTRAEDRRMAEDLADLAKTQNVVCRGIACCC